MTGEGLGVGECQMVGQLREIARKLRRDQTGAEQKLWSKLRDRRLNGLKFRRQKPLGPYVADFVCEGAMLIVELDGHSMQTMRLLSGIKSGRNTLRFEATP